MEESVVTEISVSPSVEEAFAAEAPKVGVPIEKSDKELSWEKIAAEIVADAEAEQNNEMMEDSQTEVVLQESTSTVEETTVINNGTEEKFVTESSEVTETVIPIDAENSQDVCPVAEAIDSSLGDDTITFVKECVDEVIEADHVTDLEKSENDIDKKLEEVKDVEGEEIEYTEVEPETNDTIEEHLSQTKTTETVVIVNPDETQTEVTIEQYDECDRSEDNSQHSYVEEIYLVSKESDESIDDPSVKEQEKPKKQAKRRGRKPIADIPLHVLGRDISKPTEGVSNGGRTMPKPRLGVKVPYRNLTSQIVSKQEIEKEIMDRFKQKQEQNATSSADVMFARKLTQRLAKKLIPTEADVAKATDDNDDDKPSSSSVKTHISEIKNNSDLIAILEGDGDDIELTKQNQEVQAPLSEKEIALQQLAELPLKPKVVKKTEDEKKEPISEAPHAPAKQPVEIEPRLKTGMVIKTYTRKRRSPDIDVFLPPKKSVVAATIVKNEENPSGTVYITKSSRIIKRKVIWDPDEIPNKSPSKTIKIENVKSPPPAKAIEKKEQVAEKTEKKAISSPLKKIITKTSPIKKPKRLTEVDRLLMDEGAVNMLYDVKNNEEASPDKKKKVAKNVISLDKAHKELMSKTSVIKNELQQNTNKEFQKNLRNKGVTTPPAKKEVIPAGMTRKKSKDSSRSSVHSPPASPSYHTADASRIIRRHSSSSFSSSNEMDEDELGEERISRKRAASESAKKKIKKMEAKVILSKTNNNHSNEEKTNSPDKVLTVTKRSNLVTVRLANVSGKCYLNDRVMKELIVCLKEHGKDEDCHVLSIIADNAESFCEGLDYELLVEDDEGLRKKRANEWAALVKDFLLCLLNFPKVLIAGIQGNCVGLGVTMLPLFDMVIASDTSTFSTPYASVKSIPEAGFLLTIPHLCMRGLASELLYTSQTIKADDAFRRGLVTRLCWPEKYQQELKSILNQVANQPFKSLIATKQQLSQNWREGIESQLNSMNKVLVGYWTSAECQKSFSK